MYSTLERRLAARVREFLKQQYQVDMPNIVVDQPPNVALGEFALPLSFELAKKLRKPPRKIAEEIVAGLDPVEGFERFEVAGAGYINARVDRAAFAAGLLSQKTGRAGKGDKVLVEHTSINPNKAGHIGHLRNAIL